MVAAKGKFSVGINRVAEDAHTSRTGVRTFKVYSENEKMKDAASIKSARDNLLPARRISNKEDPLAITSDSKLPLTCNMKGSSKIVVQNKGKHDTSRLTVNQNARRKALADVSNVQSSCARNAAYGGLKSVISSSTGSRTVNLSSRKSAMGKMKDNTSRKAGDFHASRKGDKDLRASLDDQKTNTKNHGREFGINKSRRNAGNLVAAMRKSLPVLKRVSHADASNAKENDENFEKTKNISGFPVKVKVGKKVVSQGGVGRSHLWRNRVSDGFILMAPRDRANADARVSRKSVRPILKTEINHKTSRSKCISSSNKSECIAAISSKKKGSATSCSENMPLVAHEDVTQGEPSPDSNKKSGADNKSNVNTIRKSSRRRSYTSLLMTGPKLLEEHGEVIEQEKLPSIDDTFNQLEVAEYVDEIYEYYWVLEVQNLCLENYMAIHTEITPQMRGIVINWLIEVHFKFELMPETLYLMVTLLDRYLSQVEIKKSELQLVGLTALLLASKYEDFWHPRIKDLISISAESYTRGQMFVMEKLFLKKLKFRLNEPTPYVFMLRFLKAAQTDQKLEHLAFYLIELCMVEYKALKFKPSMLCASAIYVARSTLQVSPAWTPLLTRHTHYQVSQIRDCAEMILRFQKAARTSQLRVTYEKYMRPDLSGVAAIKPLNELPL
ncbi:PREDICTED: putative cyclin-B3-1 isoform X2 [Populus euphratica]|uniref:B-like cyclin n=1 Tax=Populus euphratica TaxID=75702 RepID=A0AAJ6TNG5_POPEU|nr:PREDICTED: putative cyclin-B3-1 isoform X2 [Populus euphratica]